MEVPAAQLGPGGSIVRVPRSGVEAESGHLK